MVPTAPPRDKAGGGAGRSGPRRARPVPRLHRPVPPGAGAQRRPRAGPRREGGGGGRAAVRKREVKPGPVAEERRWGRVRLPGKGGWAAPSSGGLRRRGPGGGAAGGGRPPRGEREGGRRRQPPYLSPPAVPLGGGGGGGGPGLPVSGAPSGPARGAERKGGGEESSAPRGQHLPPASSSRSLAAADTAFAAIGRIVCERRRLRPMAKPVTKQQDEGVC